MSNNIGIHDLEAATAHYVLPLDALAEAHGIDPAKFHRGLGQDRFSVPAPDEDVVTMAASAASRLLARHPEHNVRMVIFATETGVDQSKSAGVFLHGLIGLGPHVRTIEYKQACYAGTAGIQAALGHISRYPDEQVLVVASDIARYALDTAGEPTQGAGAVAMLISADPALVAIEPQSGLYTADVNDFWRPNDSSTPFVEGRLSMDAYIEATLGSWDDFTARRQLAVTDVDRFIHHQPFTKMARKAHAALAAHTGVELGDELIEESMTYNRQLGNAYTASMYFGLAAQLHADTDLAGKRLGFFSYGSGAVAEFFTGVVQDGYRAHLDAAAAVKELSAREEIDYPTYRALHEGYRGASEDYDVDAVTQAPFRFTGVKDRVRHYAAR
ncbi:MAG: hydroxymethylglutaryl-CoA synthase [Micrococcaceae bacterium]